MNKAKDKKKKKKKTKDERKRTSTTTAGSGSTGAIGGICSSYNHCDSDSSISSDSGDDHVEGMKKARH